MEKEENIIKEFCIKTGNDFEEILEVFKNGLTRAEQKEAILKMQKELNFNIKEFLSENEFEIDSYYEDNSLYRRFLDNQSYLYVRVIGDELYSVYLEDDNGNTVFLSNVNTFDKLVNLVMVLF